MSNEKRMWVPEIVYEEYENSGLTDGLPFITIPGDKEMPGVLFFLGTQETGEYEPGPDGEELPVTDFELHQYADMAVLKEKLSPPIYDIIRAVLGLEPLKVAVVKGKEITENVRINMSS